MSKQLYKIQTRNGSVRRTQLKEIEPGHMRRVEVGTVEFSVDVFIDLENVGWMANAAALSKGGKCTAGPVTVKVTKRIERPL